MWGAMEAQGSILAGPGSQHPSAVLLFAATQSTNIVPFVSFLPSYIFLITKVGLGCIQTDVCLLQAPRGGETGPPRPQPLAVLPQLCPWLEGKEPSSTPGDQQV